MKVYVAITGHDDKSIEKIFTDKNIAEEYAELTSCELIEYDVDNSYKLYEIYEYEIYFSLDGKKYNRIESRNNCFDEQYFDHIKVGEPNLNIIVLNCNSILISIRIKIEYNKDVPVFNYVKELKLLKDKYITAKASLYDEDTIYKMLDRSLKDDLKELFLGE